MSEGHATGMTTVHVDFNDVARDGKVVALRDRADGPLAIGDLVTAVDQFDGELATPAVVAEQDDDGRVLYLAPLAGNRPEED
ncbi:hypothetical protein [Nocardia farcinica]|uniref:Uncharacterized protein n=1 Tax=Nocardia farcinica (strain IFM 10152) TaxID=247156 RepID=B2RGL5_NOCFA|nr:hypothetical protein [Nocardia farcinica]BAG32218.1 hypothetical protein NFA_255 [Nocardia farcinica IFM 10152]